MLTKDEQLILQLFIKTRGLLTSESIAYKASLSSKTIRKKIIELNEKLMCHGALINMRKGVGYVLEVNDEELFSLFRYDNLSSNQMIDKSNSKGELGDLIVALLSQSAYIKADDLADLIYVSKSKLTQLLNEVRSILAQYDLKLISKPHYGVKIEGDEFNYRRFISSNYAQNIPLYLDDNIEFEKLGLDIQFNEIKELVLSIFTKEDYMMLSSVVNSIVIHLAIMMLRVNKGLSISSHNQTFKSSNYPREMQIAQGIIAKVEEKYSVSIPKQEVEYITIHIVSKRVLDEDDSQHIPNEINILIGKILGKVKESANIDLLDDFDLRMMLALHLVPLSCRMQYGMDIKNPILEEVKSKCIAAFDLAIICTNYINEYYNVSLSEHEISYFALHFDVALNREKNRIKKKRVLVVCASGRASAQLLKYKFMSLFTKYLEAVEVCDIGEINHYINKNKYDFIFTTIPLTVDTMIPIFEFQFFLNEGTIKKIDSVLNARISQEEIKKYFKPSLFFEVQDFSDKVDALNYMLDEIVVKEKLPESFKEAVWERENFCGTDIMPNVALPHPSHTMSENTWISVMILKKPLVWNNNKIRAIFLVSIASLDSEKYAFIYEWILNLLSNDTALKHVIDEGTYEALMYEVLQMNINKGV